MICPYIVNVSLLLGGIMSWGIMWPLISTKKGSWYPETLPDSSLHGLHGYRVSYNLVLLARKKKSFCNQSMHYPELRT
jgi:hypothetical protein